jgi:hypothetical protein
MAETIISTLFLCKLSYCHKAGKRQVHAVQC